MNSKKLFYIILGFILLLLTIDTLDKSKGMAKNYFKLKNLERVLPIFKKGQTLYCGNFSNYDKTLINITSITNKDWSFKKSNEYFMESVFVNKNDESTIFSYTCSDKNTFEDIVILLDKINQPPH